MRIPKYVWLVATLAVLSPGVLMARPHSRSVTDGSQVGYARTEGRILLNQIQDHASAISKEVGPLDLQTRYGEVDWWTQSSTLNEVRDNVNVIGKDLNRLVELRTQLEPWEQREIDRIAPLAVEIADATKDGIRTFNRNQDHTWNTQLPADLTTLSNKADELSKSVNESLESAKLNKEIERLEQKS